ncbi:MAG: peptidoglycan-binding protein [Myxococcota bacterium]
MPELRPYVVQQGDFLVRIAARAGVEPREIWDLPENEALRDLRGNPDTLFPGDVLQVPIVEPPSLPISAGTSNRYEAVVPTANVRVALRDGAGEPRAGVAFTVLGLPQPIEGATDGEGMVDVDVPINLGTVTLLVDGDPTRYQINVGHLDPVEADSGVRQRLTQLGYLSAAARRDDPEELAGAIRRFQLAEGIDATGEPDAATRTALRDTYGS